MRKPICTVLLLTLIGVGDGTAAAQDADTIEQGFVPAKTSQKFASLDDQAIGWIAVDARGEDLSSSREDPCRVTADPDAPDGDGYRLFAGSRSDQDILILNPELETPIDLATPLVMKFAHRDNDPNSSSAYRAVVRVGTTWFCSKLLPTRHEGDDGDWATTSVELSEKHWYTWETSLPTSFDVSAIGDQPQQLPDGELTAVGLLLINDEVGDTFRIDAFEVRPDGQAEPQ
jgi:hypothetical protein